MAGLDITGFTGKTFEDVEGEMDDALHAGISPTLNLTSTSAYGQLKSVSASHIGEVWDGAVALWLSWDVDSAKGAALDRLGRLTGSTRLPATASTAVMTLDLDAGTYAAGDLVVTKVGDGTVRFSNPAEIVLASDNATYSTEFASEETGPVAASPGQLSVIANPVVGFNSATNPASAVLGRVVESDTQFRRRRSLELALKGSTTVDAIRGDLLQMIDPVTGQPLFTFVGVVENDGDTVDGAGRAPHSFETLVLSGQTDAVIEAAILSVKPSGIKAYGLTTGTVYDSQSNPHVIGFSRPTDIPIYFSLRVKYIAGLYVGDDAVREAVVNFAAENQGVGADVLEARYTQIVMDLPGVVDVLIFQDVAPSPSSGGNIIIGAREIASVTDDNTEVLSVAVPGVP